MSSWWSERAARKERARLRADLDAAGIRVGQPHPALAEALSGAVHGSAAPAAALLAQTRAQGLTDLRSHAVDHLGRAGASNASWLDAWSERDPENPDLGLVRIATTVHRAWEIRTHARATAVSSAQWQQFFATLESVEAPIARATLSNPDDPVVWEWTIRYGRGSQAPTDLKQRYESELLRADPGHLPGLVQALTGRLPRWSGAPMREVFAFAHERALAAPATAAELLPLVAAVESMVEEPGNPRGGSHHFDVLSAMRSATAWLDGPGAGHFQAPVGHSMMCRLAWAMGDRPTGRRHLEALGTWVPAFPWDYSRDPTGVFARARAALLGDDRAG